MPTPDPIDCAPERGFSPAGLPPIAGRRLARPRPEAEPIRFGFLPTLALFALAASPGAAPPVPSRMSAHVPGR